jgi:hypothetical protein
MSKFLEKTKATMKQLFLTKEGWIGWIVANIITSLPWAIPFALGFIFKETYYYAVAGSIWAFMMLPLTPFWILNVIIAVFVAKLLSKKHIKQRI